jgi:RNA polymerase sigma factor (sigma-70 family)
MSKSNLEFEKIYRDNYKFVLNFCFKRARGFDRETVLDIVQDTFFRAYKSFSTFRKGSKPSTWLCSIARNLIIDHARRSKTSVKTIPVSALGNSNNNDSKDTETGLRRALEREWHAREQQKMQKEAQDKLIDSLLNIAEKKLIPTHLRIFRMIHMDGLDLKEVAIKTKTKYTNVRKINSRCLKMMKANCSRMEVI